MNISVIVIIIGIVIGLVLVFLKRRYSKSQSSALRFPKRDLPWQWVEILKKNVSYYNNLNTQDKKRFEYKVHVFLLNVQVIGEGTQVTDKDRLLVAASGVIPLFNFQHWHYSHLKEVHIYPSKFPIPESDKMARGLVGWGAMEGRMFLSRKALYEGFENSKDGKNVAIHEFIHLLDKKDGEVDGILEELMDESNIAPWLRLVHQKMREIADGKSSVRKYGAVNREEFMAVVSEYFFERPEKLKKEDPALYMALDNIFNPSQPHIVSYNTKGKSSDLTGSYRCPCGSGKTYAECCQKYNIVYSD